VGGEGQVITRWVSGFTPVAPFAGKYVIGWTAAPDASPSAATKGRILNAAATRSDQNGRERRAR